jgi:Ohr subfamily peroxiredoxin
MDPIYTATAHSTGDGRNGHVTSDDGFIDLDLRIPKEMGGSGGATNPEELFAAGYAACFHSAMKLVAGQQKLDVEGTQVSASIGIGPLDDGGFGRNHSAVRSGRCRPLTSRFAKCPGSWLNFGHGSRCGTRRQWCGHRGRGAAHRG